MNKTSILSNFWIKVLACLFMTIDHIGLCMSIFLDNTPTISTISYIFRIIGRLAYPLFFFLIIEGCRHTKSFPKYFLRLGIFALIIAISIMVIYWAILPNPNYISGLYNIFITLLLVSSSYFFLVKCKKWFKLLTLIPFIYLLLATLVEFNVLYFTDTTSKVLFSSIMPDYGSYTLFALVFYYIIYFINEFRIKKHYSNNLEEIEIYKASQYYLVMSKATVSISIVLTALLCYLFTYIEGFGANSLYILSTYTILSAVIILLYNGKLGFSNKYIKYGFYLYYPLHLLIIFGIFNLITML